MSRDFVPEQVSRYSGLSIGDVDDFKRQLREELEKLGWPEENIVKELSTVEGKPI